MLVMTNIMRFLARQKSQRFGAHRLGGTKGTCYSVLPADNGSQPLEVAAGGPVAFAVGRGWYPAGMAKLGLFATIVLLSLCVLPSNVALTV